MNKHFFFFLFSLISFTATSQSPRLEVVAVAGDSHQTSNIQIDWTVGEIAISSLYTTNSMLTQGFQQPYYIISANDHLPTEISKINIYPNPTSDLLSIELALDKKENIDIVLFDLNGKTIQKNTFMGQKIQTSLSLSNLPSGTYFLSIKIGNKGVFQTHKIQKLN